MNSENIESFLFDINLDLDLYVDDISDSSHAENFVSTSTVSTESSALSGSCPTSSVSTYTTMSSVSG
ncbi:thiocillin family RiPP [Staphylococcus pseudintermedius]|uniref:thiocillin family RiPP n=2 Tax=Staphylococcus pseudintermedius TaxID=283734 RepID=UPI000BBC9F3E|nr:thiocillin family RiPP [Staphylococcus pseudintermedius]EGQ0385186.1 thiocillin family RiPP [Staphylococcus pseudintermedius]EGQ1298012.1 thiocillin family RiPP [Staphylococcus pseudintermedius]EGQ1660192.1 thiocillin family RiPP [Staphylococcus pseudintermedius]EGQ1674283.1 thiocillin family RiPP [Staphylococcus pseudintermedius]EGQ1709885.1 thiocillin family RiPP [Staphylococcus pseudintermedius]